MSPDPVPDRPPPADAAAARPSVHVRRARQLLLGGLAGGLAATVVSLVVATVVFGVRGLLSAALAAGLVLFFYVAGQYVMVLFADAGARLLLAVSMASYTTRVLLIGLVLLAYERFGSDTGTLVPMVVFLTTVAVVAGWLIVEVWVFSRLRIGVYDAEYQPPVNAGSQP